jgi:hypothetical protein
LFVTGQIEIPAKTQVKPESGLFTPGKVVKIGFIFLTKLNRKGEKSIEDVS